MLNQELCNSTEESSSLYNIQTDFDTWTAANYIQPHIHVQLYANQLAVSPVSINA